MSSSQYVFFSAPLTEGSREKEFSKLEKLLAPSSDCSAFVIPELRVGTFDNLMLLSDELNKHDSVIETVLGKLLKTLSDLDKSEFVLKVEDSTTRTGVLPQQYLKAFKWDEAQCPKGKHLNEHVELLIGRANRVDEELKTKLSEYAQAKSASDSLARKEMGSLSVKSLSGIVKKEHVVDTEYLTTVFVAVPKQHWKDWEKTYYTLNEFVVPDYTKRIEEDNDFGLYSAVVFRKTVENFAHECREHKYVVRDYVFEETAVAEAENQKKEIEEKQTDLKRDIIRLCQSGFGDVFSAWIHVKAIRVFVESVLRYGVPPRFCAAFLKLKKSETKVHRDIVEAYKFDGSPDSVVVGGSKGKISSEDLALIGAANVEYYPYVWIPINLSYPGLVLTQ